MSRTKPFAFTILVSLFLTACFFNPPKKGRKRERINLYESDLYGTGKSLIYEDNPIILSGNYNLGYVNMIDYVNKEPLFVTNNSFLQEDCSFSQRLVNNGSLTNSSKDNCINVFNDMDLSTSLLQSTYGSWNFEVNSKEFYQVNAFYHTNLILDKYMEAMEFTHDLVHFQDIMVIPPATKADMIYTNSYWFSPTDIFSEASLNIYSSCELDKNSFYSFETRSLCMGRDFANDNFKFVQDPTVLYHEMGHAFVSVMMNQRNSQYDSLLSTTTSTDYYAHLGDAFYDEPGAINEGIADYFAWMMLGGSRDRVGEWGMGRFFRQSRPMRESDDLHINGISTASGEKLKYPDFLHYDPNFPDEVAEDVHYAGQITSHYLAYLTRRLEGQCSFSHIGSNLSDADKFKYASYYVFAALNETMAEVGDLYTEGTDFNPNTGYVNLNEDNSYLWTHVVNPPTYRRFFQIFARSLLYHVTNNYCTEYSIDELEQDLDEYGLLLFRDYRDEGYNSDGTQTYANMTSTPLFQTLSVSSWTKTSVNEANRRHSILISKEELSLPGTNDTRPEAYIFDSQSAINSILNELTFMGENVSTSAGLAGTEYNNSNIQISPGEVVGISLNLINNSNSTMAGVQILGNDWDHMRLTDTTDQTLESISPCIYDDWPTTSEGGFEETDDGCNAIVTDNAPFVMDTSNNYPQDFASPVCLVEKRDDDSTQWVSQNHFRQISGLDLSDYDCLNNPNMSGDAFNPNECLVRILPGASSSYFGKVDPTKSWPETMQGDGSQSVTFTSSNVILMEVNKWVPPGTKFTCRFRTRFTNCADCYNDPDNSNDEYLDYEFAGHEPFQLINFSFIVIE
ncbi:hypothetical protein N9N67_06810 [Bacteriovoracaceae bacterium]|nr:hypothetical protein [Bacteriovoracaceae bacterium]